MEDLLRFFATYEYWIYALLGLVGILYVRKLFAAWQEWRGSVFGLERESAQRRLSASVSILALLALAAASEFVLVSFVSPGYAGLQQLPTPTVDLLATPSVTLPVADLESATPEPTSDSGPTLAPVVDTGCVEGQIEWTYPLDQEEIQGVIEPRGVVNVPNLGFYKYEFTKAGEGNWTAIAAGNLPRNDEPLGGSWNTDQVTPGDYELRLVVTDNQNGIFPACVISVRIVGE